MITRPKLRDYCNSKKEVQNMLRLLEQNRCLTPYSYKKATGFYKYPNNFAEELNLLINQYFPSHQKRYTFSSEKQGVYNFGVYIEGDELGRINCIDELNKL
ncbi:hypothetical protein D0784_21165 [Vibrio campbellii]|nr:hypothetical protein D0784_21165 [Vibrio campbellii]